MNILDKINNKDTTKSKDKDIAKIHNNFIETYMYKSNLVALKILFYISRSNLENKIEDNFPIRTIKIDTKKLCEYCNIDIKTLRKHIMNDLMKTSILTINTNEEIEKVVLIPRAKFLINKNILEVDIYKNILNMILGLERKYTTIDTINFMKLRNRHSLKMIQILEMIDGFSSNVAKRKIYTLEDINGIFGTNYKNCYTFEKKVLSPIQNELNSESKLTFMYSTNYIKLDKGRPKAIGFIIDLIDNKERQPLLF